MTLAWEIERLREFGRMRLGDPSERARYFAIVDMIAKRFRLLEDALR